MQVGLQTLGMYVAILSYGSGVPGCRTVEVLSPVAEMILAAGGQGLGIDAQTEAVAHLPLIER